MEKDSVLLSSLPHDGDHETPLHLAEVSTPDLSKIANGAASTVLESIAETPAFLGNETTGASKTINWVRTGNRIDDKTENLDPENQ